MATNTKKVKNKKKMNDVNIPKNQKHQLVSLDEFGAYDYNKRRKQWHQKAGYNQEQVLCNACGDNDNWATVQLNNGAHICYFCWVKKPTEETKKKLASIKTTKDLVVKNKKETKKIIDEDAEQIYIEKFYDKQGVSFRNLDDVHKYKTKKNTIDKTSRYGVNPSVFYDSSVDYSDDFDKVVVVNKYDENYLYKAAKNARKLADNMSKEAINQYNEDVTRAKLVTRKNMTNAKVESLRTLTKAIVLEKNYYETLNEAARHQKAIENIKLLRKQRLEKNKADLQYNLHNIKVNNEIEMKKNEDNLIKTRIKIEEKSAIIDLKRSREKEKVRVLSRGETYKSSSSLKQKIKDIRNKKSIPGDIALDSQYNSLAELIRKLKDMDPNRLTRQERDLIVKFLNLVENYQKQEKYAKMSSDFIEAIKSLDKKIAKTLREGSKTQKKQEYMIVSYESYKKIVNAKKETLCISEPINMMEQPTVRTKVIKVKKPAGIMDPVKSTSLVKIRPQKVHFEKLQPQKIDINDLYYAKDIQKTIDKFRKIVGKAFMSDGFDVSPYGNNAYKMNYQKMKYTKYELRYKNDWRSKFKWMTKSKQEDLDYNGEIQYKNLEELDQGNWFTNLFKEKVNDYGEPIPKGINKLRKLLERLPSDPVVIEHEGEFSQERADIESTIRRLKNLEVTNNWTQDEVDRALQDVNNILDIYHAITAKDVKYRKNIMLAQDADEKLAKKIIKDEKKIANAYARADMNYAKRAQMLADRYERNIENAENQSLLNIEYIYDQEQDALAKEEEQHLWNESSMYEANNKLANNQYKYQNALIGATLSEITKFNKKANNPIQLNDVASKILPLPVNSNENLSLNVEKVGSDVVVTSTSKERRGESKARAVNKNVPNNIEKIYVLDKFRNIQDIKTRVALLSEYAKVSYEKAEKINKIREEKEIKIAEERLSEKMKKVDAIYNDSTKIKHAAKRLEHVANERDWVQNNFEQLKSEKWKVYDKDQKYKEKIARLQMKEQELEMIKAQKEMNRYKKQKSKLLKSSEEVNYEDVIGKKTSKR